MLTSVVTVGSGLTLAGSGRTPGAEESDVDSMTELDRAAFSLLGWAFCDDVRRRGRFVYLPAAPLRVRPDVS